MRKKISILLSVVLSTTLLYGCNKKMDNEKETKVYKEVNIAAPDGLPAISMAKLAKENISIQDEYKQNYIIEKSAEALSTDVMKEKIDIAIVPSNMAAIAYNKTSNYKIAGTVGMGSFYLVSSEDITDFEDLVGKEVGNIGKGLTPESIVQNILKAKNIDSSKINFNYVNSANELIPMLLTGKIKTAFVPEPALTALTSKNKEIKVIKSLNDEWKEVTGFKEGYPQSTLIIKEDFIKENKDFVEKFLGALTESISWANINTSKIGEYCKEIGISTEHKVIGESLKRANLNFIPIKNMKKEYNDYYQKLSEFDIKTVGGKLPDEGIYFTEK
ncbi:ABC transporter substrate-binding protein [Romboutsia maritimum]|uniref:ABC transporter substrate-binding protein n=1 Tax=Romboutsia maritimum TaxID=2020948 RepID=A0A371IT37_9FIRM|nr:MqnA/MqnD/SBP family protein [Romboutsia maritimum]RDY23650.1 ABC transporter substrate-binding protein [Romboutsia maritimum]